MRDITEVKFVANVSKTRYSCTFDYSEIIYEAVLSNSLISLLVCLVQSLKGSCVSFRLILGRIWNEKKPQKCNASQGLFSLCSYLNGMQIWLQAVNASRCEASQKRERPRYSRKRYSRILFYHVSFLFHFFPGSHRREAKNCTHIREKEECEMSIDKTTGK